MSALPALASIPFALVDLELFMLVWYRPFVIAVAIIWAIAYGFAVLRVRIADVEALIRSSAGYAVATGASIVILAACVLATSWFTGQIAGGLVAVVVFGPIRTSVTRWLD